MKLLLVLEDDSIRTDLSYHLRPLGFELIQYQNPLKALDNLDEIQPELVLFSGEDFPRHWKPMVQFIRNKHKKEECVFILLKGADFPMEEAAKASFLGVNGMLSSNLQDKQELLRIIELFRRYQSLDDLRSSDRIIPDSTDRFELVFTLPGSLSLVTGVISDISNQGASFKPTNPRLTADLKEGDVIENSSLRIGSSIVAVNCKVVRRGNVIGLEFTRFEDNGKQVLSDYIENHSIRELQKKIFKKAE
ncbi:MAG: PilZ domain-containing protein [Spirochaetia bacterium]